GNGRRKNGRRVRPDGIGRRGTVSKIPVRPIGDAPVFTRAQASLNDLRSVLPLVLEARREVLATGGRGGTVSMAYSASGTGEAGRSSRAEGRGSSRGRSRSRRAACRRARSPTIRVSSRP